MEEEKEYEFEKDELNQDKPEVKLKSEMYNHDNENIVRRDEENHAVMWGFVIGFILFFLLLIMIIIFTN